ERLDADGIEEAPLLAVTDAQPGPATAVVAALHLRLDARRLQLPAPGPQRRAHLALDERQHLLPTRLPLHHPHPRPPFHPLPARPPRDRTRAFQSAPAAPAGSGRALRMLVRFTTSSRIARSRPQHISNMITVKGSALASVAACSAARPPASSSAIATTPSSSA